ncbi:MAG: hypothetical protein S0880_30830 [Actinomycetota bacterium]|nr:hypothetical protein [Actinomycetota bacterium]
MNTWTAAVRRGPGTGKRVAAWGVVLVLGGLGVLFLDAAGVDPMLLTRDPTASSGANPATGSVSILGSMAWAAGAASCLTAAAAIRHLGPRRRVRFLAGLGLFCLGLGIDDTLLVHEYYLAELLGVPELVTYAAIAATAIAFTVVNAEALKASRHLLLLALAVVGLGGSVALDIIVPLGSTLEPLEDVAKIWGLAAFVSFAAAEALDALRPLVAIARRRMERPQPPAMGQTGPSAPPV